MNVRELIQLLERERQDLPVFVEHYDSGAWHLLPLRDYTRKSVEFNGDVYEAVVISEDGL